MKKVIILSVIILSILSCKKEDDCEEVLLDVKNLETDYGCRNTKHTLVIDLINEVKIIRSMEDYDGEVSGPCHPDINFSENDLIIGKHILNNVNDTITYDYRRACPGENLTLTVELTQFATSLPDTVVYHAIIPKLDDGESVDINLTIRTPQ
jgi:hypothetical protein